MQPRVEAHLAGNPVGTPNPPENAMLHVVFARCHALQAAYLQFIEAVKKGWVVNLVMTRIGSNTVVAEAKKDPRLQVETVQVGGRVVV